MYAANENPDRINDHVSKTVLSVEILHPSDMDPSKMSQAEISGFADMGQLVTRTTVVSSEELSDANVDDALEQVGGQPGHYARADILRERRADKKDLQASS